MTEDKLIDENIRNQEEMIEKRDKLDFTKIMFWSILITITLSIVYFIKMYFFGG